MAKRLTKFDKALRAELDALGFGDIDPVTGPESNPHYFSERYRVLEFLKAADAHAHPVFPAG